ncbi:hypothetical protein [Akkermansia sp.]|uniref:hypothetical protein n=1 Tax=Akkermansia sp. TaxID=1872421 RepID=UPI003AB8CB78
MAAQLVQSIPPPCGMRFPCRLQGERRIFDDGQFGRRRIEKLLDLFQIFDQG